MQRAAGDIGDFQRPQEVNAALYLHLRGKGGVGVAGQAVDDGAHAGVGGVAQFLAHEVDAFHQGAAVNPFGAFVPAFHAGGLEDALAHIHSVAGHLVGAEGGLAVGAGHADGTDYQFHRALDAGEAGVGGFEVVGVEQGAQDGADFVAGGEVGRHHILDDGFGGGGYFVGGKELEEAGADEPGGGFLLDDDVDDVLAVEVAGVAEEGFFGVIVVVVAVVEVPVDAAVGPDGVAAGAGGHIFGVAEGPAGEGAGAFLDVVLGVVADAH